jgi:predicted negative regulator of RcsB-dependent stress response
MSRNILYVIIGVLVAAGLVLGYQYYREQQKTAGIHIDVGKGGASIETK